MGLCYLETYFYYDLQVIWFARHWFYFIFMAKEHVKRVLNEYWIIRDGSLVLWNWLVDFKPLTQKVYKRHLWVLFPWIPIQFWTEDLLIKINNHLWNFIVVEKVVLWSGDKRMAWVMVELNILKGLTRILFINWGDISLDQRLDYRVVPLCCLIFHNTGHVKTDCHFLVKNSASGKF